MNLARQEWITLYGTGGFPHPVAISTGWRIRFPHSGSINYIVTRERHKQETPSKLSIRYRVASTKGAAWEAMGRQGDEGLEPNFRPILLDVMGADFGRWWPRVGVTLGKGSRSVSWDMSPENWTSVSGVAADENEMARVAFRRAMKRARYGITFGGGNSYGHGVRMLTGKASLTVTQFLFN